MGIEAGTPTSQQPTLLVVKYLLPANQTLHWLLGIVSCLLQTN